MKASPSLLVVSFAATLLSACSAPSASPLVTGGRGDSAPAAAVGGAAYRDGVYDGSSFHTPVGNFRAQVTIAHGAIAGVAPIEAGTNERESRQINSVAIPRLVSSVLAAQSAAVDYVSGASYTSEAFLSSIGDALASAG